MCVFLPSSEGANDVAHWSLNVRWQFASSLTTLHLLSAIALFNTFMDLKGFVLVEILLPPFLKIIKLF